VRGCAARMAQEFGDAPEASVARMRWARRVVSEVFSAPATRKLADYDRRLPLAG